jgi:hypothetical protein
MYVTALRAIGNARALNRLTEPRLGLFWLLPAISRAGAGR